MVQEQVAQEAQARQLELEEERAKREEREAQRAAEEVAEAERNRKRWQRLGQELERVGISLDEFASIIMTSDTESLGQLLDGTLPDDRHVWDFNDEMASYGVFSELAENGVSIDYVLTGKRAEVSQDSQWQQGTPTENGYYFCIKRWSNWAGLYWWQDDHWEQAAAICTAYICVDLWAPAPIIPGWRAWEREEV